MKVRVDIDQLVIDAGARGLDPDGFKAAIERELARLIDGGLDATAGNALGAHTRTSREARAAQDVAARIYGAMR